MRPGSRKLSAGLANPNAQIRMKVVAQQSVSSSGTDGGSKTDLMNTKVIKTTENNLLVNLPSEPQNQSPYSHQVTSMNESKAKQVCKKRPLDVIRSVGDY